MTPQRMEEIRIQARGRIAEVVNGVAFEARDELNSEEVRAAVIEVASGLFEVALKKSPRYPMPLAADCAYVVMHMNGVRRGKKLIRRFLNETYGSSPVILPKSRSTKTRWVEEPWAREAILSLSPVEEAYEEMISEG